MLPRKVKMASSQISEPSQGRQQGTVSETTSCPALTCPLRTHRRYQATMRRTTRARDQRSVTEFRPSCAHSSFGGRCEDAGPRRMPFGRIACATRQVWLACSSLWLSEVGARAFGNP